MAALIPEQALRQAVDLLVRLVEIAGVLVIFAGAAVAFARYAVLVWSRDPERFSAVRLQLGRYLALGLEFQLASDLLRTAVAPNFEQIGKLAAVAAIRTALNFFLARELEHERARGR